LNIDRFVILEAKNALFGGLKMRVLGPAIDFPTWRSFFSCCVAVKRPPSWKIDRWA